MLLAVLSGYIAAFLAPYLHRLVPRFSGLILAAVPLTIFLYLFNFLNPVIDGEALSFTYTWVPSLDVNLDFNIDGLSLFFGLLISSFGALIVIYTSGYLKDHPLLGRFYLYILLFMASMLGVVFSGNLFCLFVFWEMTSLSSYLLIGFNHDQKASRRSALQAMLVTVGGGMALLAGLVLLSMAGVSTDMAELSTKGELIKQHDLYNAIVILILIGAFTKSAQFPFHFWLPNAMAAPTPVSAYLHSATMVKAGVYLVARLTPVLSGSDLWQLLLIIAGATTMTLGATLAIQHKDLKKILAYTTISALGILFLMLGIGSTIAIQAAIIFILAHALYKGTLFLITGNLDHETGTRDITQLSGLRKLMPVTAVATILACMSMAGVMPFFGFIGKEVVYGAALESTFYNIILLIAVVISGVFFVSVAIDVGYGIYYGPVGNTPKKPHEAPAGMLAAPVVFSGAGLIIGLFAAALVQPLLNAASDTVMNRHEKLHLALWHGFNLAFGLSLLTLALGYVTYRARHSIRAVSDKYEHISNWGPSALYERTLISLTVIADKHTRFLQNGRLRSYLSNMLSFFCLIIGTTLIVKNLGINIADRVAMAQGYTIYEVVVALLIILGLALVFYTTSRLTAVVALGVVGYSVALLFILFGAPDVAMTQFLVETLTVVLFVIALQKLPPFRIFNPRSRRMKYLLLSLVFGAFMSFVVLKVTSYPMDSSLKDFYAETSAPVAHGRNIVNVILVDFRGLDTLGESTVLGIAALGIFSLLRLRIEKGGSK
jgi:multicomponent Na+:H+ antiporter subunit A